MVSKFSVMFLFLQLSEKRKKKKADAQHVVDSATQAIIILQNEIILIKAAGNYNLRCFYFFYLDRDSFIN